MAAKFPVCPSVPPTNATGIVNCLRASVSDFWSGQLNQVVDQPVIVNPTTSQVPAECRPAITETYAFTCTVDDTVFVNQRLLTPVAGQFGTSDVPYALASVISHEIGHVVQGAVKQPGLGQSDDATSQKIEQQADCLSGVWAHAEVARGDLDKTVFATVSKALITDISTNAEIRSHGTPDQRTAAIARGLGAGRPQDCGLATFS